MPEETYNRQKLIPRWNQEKLRNASVTLVGSDALAEMIAAGLVALGIGNVRIISNKKKDSITFLTANREESKADSMVYTLKKINPDVKIISVHSGIVNYASTVFFDSKADIVIDATDNPNSKLVCYKWCENNKRLMISASATGEEGEVCIIRKIDDLKSSARYAGKEQDLITAEIIGGVVLDEVRKCLMPMNGEKLLDKPFCIKDRIEIDDKKEKIDDILIVGAGALGNFCGLGLTDVNVKKITIMDGDDIEEHNLNRQVLYYDKIGRDKSEVLAKRLGQINKVIKFIPVKKFLEKDPFIFFYKPDLIVDATDNFKIRALLNEISVKHNIPLISGGTSPFEGQVISCIPRKTQCLNCKINVDALAKKSPTRAGCARTPEASVIISNMIMGGIMAREIRNIVDGMKPINGVIKYISKDPARIGILASKKPCECYKENGALKWLNLGLGRLKGMVS